MSGGGPEHKSHGGGKNFSNNKTAMVASPALHGRRKLKHTITTYHRNTQIRVQTKDTTRQISKYHIDIEAVSESNKESHRDLHRATLKSENTPMIDTHTHDHR